MPDRNDKPSAPDDTVPLRPMRPCPICGKPAVERFRPFCSKRCADVDLARWLGGVYRIPTEEDDAPPDREDDGRA